MHVFIHLLIVSNYYLSDHTLVLNTDFLIRPPSWSFQVDEGNIASAPRHKKEWEWLGINTTGWIIIGFVAGVVVIDVILSLTDKQTISQAVWNASKAYPAIPFAAGIVAGHLFFR